MRNAVNLLILVMLAVGSFQVGFQRGYQKATPTWIPSASPAEIEKMQARHDAGQVAAEFVRVH